NHGLEQMEAWHDTAGNLVMWIVLPGLLLLGHVMKRREDVIESPVPLRSGLPSMPRWIGVAAIVWIVFSEVSTEAWYRLHDSMQIQNQRWSMAWPSNNPQFKSATIPDRSLAILLCSSSYC